MKPGRYIYALPAGKSPSYFLSGNWIYDMAGRPAFYVAGAFAYTPAGQPAFTVRDKYLCANDAAAAPQFRLGEDD